METTEKRFLNSLLAASGSQIGRTALRLVADLTLARLVLPEGHGLFALAWSTVVIAGFVRDQGLPYEMVRDPRERYGSVLLWEIGRWSPRDRWSRPGFALVRKHGPRSPGCPPGAFPLGPDRRPGCGAAGLFRARAQGHPSGRAGDRPWLHPGRHLYHSRLAGFWRLELRHRRAGRLLLLHADSLATRLGAHAYPAAPGTNSRPAATKCPPVRHRAARQLHALWSAATSWKP